MNSRSSILTIVLIVLAGLLVVGVLAVVALGAIFQISSVSASTVEPVEAIIEAGTLPEAIQSPSDAVGSDAIEAIPEAGSGVVVPPGFIAVLDDRLHSGFAYPAVWEKGNWNFAYCRVFYVKDPEPFGVGPLPKLIITFIPLDDSQAEGAYNFMSNETIQSFMALPVGEAQPLVPDAIPVEAFTYKRLPDQQVGGWQAVVIENEQVWEAPEPSTERRVLISTEAGTIIIGSIYETPEELALFEQVLGTFQFLP